MPKRAIQRFIKLEASGGILLFAAAALSMVVANSALADYLNSALNARASVIIGPLAIDKSVLLWINDGLMAIFFLLVGLELKREILDGQLSDRSQLALPLIAAFGGFVLPAIFFAVINWGEPVNLQGWAIPSATDIAFALGVLSLFGSRVPLAVKVFLVSLAIIDDLAAIVVIALFYTSNLSLTALAYAGVGIAGLVMLNVFNVTRIAAYILVGVFIWVAVLKSGVHATLAGVVVAFAIPLGAKSSETGGFSPLRKLEHTLHPWVAYAILPIFAFANAGVSLEGFTLETFANPLTLGILAGLFIGKQIGVFVPVWYGMKKGWFQMPVGANMTMMYGTALATGIGFTMSFFIGSLAYEDLDPLINDKMRLGVLSGSMLSLVASLIVLYISTKLPKKAGATPHSEPAPASAQ